LSEERERPVLLYEMMKQAHSLVKAFDVRDPERPERTLEVTYTNWYTILAQFGVELPEHIIVRYSKNDGQSHPVYFKLPGTEDAPTKPQTSSVRRPEKRVGHCVNGHNMRDTLPDGKSVAYTPPGKSSPQCRICTRERQQHRKHKDAPAEGCRHCESAAPPAQVQAA